MIIIETVLAIPAVAAVLCIILSRGNWAAIATMISSAAMFVAVLVLCVTIYNEGQLEYGLWYADGLSSVFVLMIATVSLVASVYSYGYISHEREEGVINSKDERQYFSLFNLFVAIMLATCLVSSVGLMWIAIEATTLVSAFLVGFYRNGSSTEAAWKYLMICSAGITLALVGITLVYAASIDVLGGDSGALDWPVLLAAASQIDPALLKVAFVFIMIGFGTKIGLFPMHTWLPDAHSQAPTPISAMLSAVLLNCALYALIRFKIIVDITIPGYAQYLLIAFGLLSLAAAAFLILSTKDMKRMLAYSSIEHMGIIAIGFGIGTEIAVFGALFHVIAHSITKSFLFLSAGNIIHGYGTRRMSEIRGLRKNMPFTSVMFTAGALAITGLPPFAVFVGELSILLGAFSSGMYAVAMLMVLFIVIVFAGIISHVFPMLSGNTDREVKDIRNISRTVPIAMLMIISLILGLLMPDQLHHFIDNAVDVVTGGMI